MHSRHDFSRLLLAGLIGITAASPASALTDSGKDLLERLRGKVDVKVESTTVIEAPPVSDSPTAAKVRFEPGAISTEPLSETGMKSKTTEDPATGKPVRREKQTSPDTKDQQPSTTNDLLGKPPAIETASDKLAGKTSEPDMQEVLDKLEALRKRLEAGPSKDRKKKDDKLAPPLKLQEPPKTTRAPETAAVKPEKREQEPEPQAVLQHEASTSSVPGSARSFGELSDAELIQYAQEHVWSAEKSKKHNPPATPSAKTKTKKKKKEGKEAPAKSSAKSAAKPSPKKSANTTGTVIIKKAVR
ncbi:MAG TPA: hypothetical protein PKM25_00880 [Candidatus Ozemobacteraceae bacterium]|nr:hypothetical protein [Candidatus Ozemobacteraceae bacterium]